MKHLFLRFLAVAMAVVAGFGVSACSDDDGVEPNFPPASEQFSLEQKVVSEADFQAKVAGNGWLHLVSHRIKSDGTVEERSFWEGMYGGGPSHYYFAPAGKPEVTTYFYNDVLPANCFATTPYTYDATTQEVTVNGADKPLMTLLRVNSSYMYVKQFVGVTGNTEDVWVVAVYRKMSANDLERIRAEYTYGVTN